MMQPITRVDEVQHRTLGDKLADMITAGIGSWWFIMIQSVLLIAWIVLNTIVSIAWIQHWDSYPFILLNLCLSFQAAYTGPLVLKSQNRQAERDRLVDHETHEASVQDVEETQRLQEQEARQRQQLARVETLLTQVEEKIALLSAPAPKPIKEKARVALKDKKLVSVPAEPVKSEDEA